MSSRDPLGLKPREVQVLNAVAWARTQVPNGHYLTSDGQVRAAERLVARGFLTEVDRLFGGRNPVVKITAENRENMWVAIWGNRVDACPWVHPKDRR